MITECRPGFRPRIASSNGLLYTEFHMRRGASILLLSSFIAIFLLGPLAAALGDDDARLPACCRRNGAHHCSMARLRAAILASGQPIVSAPSTCPSYPRGGALTIAPVDGIAPSSAFEFEIPAALHSPAAARAAARASEARTRSSRAPPALA
jgi:hypothetical protein